MAKKTKNTHLYFLTVVSAFTLFTLPHCGKKSRHHIDISGHTVELNIHRTEADVFALRTPDDVRALRLKDSTFFDVYVNGILDDITGGMRLPEDERYRALLEFTSNRDMRDLFRTVDSMYRDLGPITEELEDAFGHFNYYFGDSLIPGIYTFVSPFRYNTVRFENNLGIGLDMYLGPEFSPYYSPGLNFPQYKIRKFRKESLVPDAIKSWLLSVYPEPEGDRRLLGEMIYEGKILYAMDALLPETEDSLKIGYLKGQIEWCRQQEYQIWNHLIEQDLLYTTDEFEYRGVFSDGPFSKGVHIPQESAPRIAVWAGWQIVRQYMDRHPEISLAELMADHDHDKILKESAYKP